MHWGRDLKDWPHAAASRRLAGPVHRWHVQIMGQGPDLLLLHGAGGSTHSWRHQMAQLAKSWRVIALDLPGHGFTTLGLRNRSGLEAMAQDVAALCLSQSWQPCALVGHSAGTAVALRMTQTGAAFEGRPVIGVNAALGSFSGLAGLLFPMMAQVMAAAPFIPSLMSRRVGTDAQIARLIQATGSTLDAEGHRLYRRLASDTDHISGTLRMMAQWDLEPLRAELPHHPSRVRLFTGDRDATVPPIVSVEAADRMPHATADTLGALGHLAHEEAPDVVNPRLAQALQTLTAPASSDALT